MPEGDTIHTLALRLRPVLQGRILQAADGRTVDGTAMVGRRVDRIHVLGKHLLLDLSDDTGLRVHLGLRGVWRLQPPDARPRPAADLFLRAGEHTHALLRAKAMEHLPRHILAVHPVLTALGPDLALPDAPLHTILARARDPRWATLAVADLLLQQQVACGIGNVFKSELLFAERIDPWTPSPRVSDAALGRLYRRANRWIGMNVRPGPRNTTGLPRPRLWVYGARRQPCVRCRGPIAHALQGPWQRVTWWCPRCQPPHPDRPAHAPVVS